MTTSVADKSPISAKARRRHQDPPGLWIIVAIASVSIHVVAFWLMRSPLDGFRPWFPQQKQTIVPIELVEISPQESTTQPQAPAAKTTPETAPTSTRENDQGINFDSSVQADNKTDAPQPNTQIFTLPTPEPTQPTPTPQPENTSTPTPTPTPEPTQPTPTPQPENTSTPTPTIPLGERPWERRQDIELGKGTPLPSDSPSVTPEEITESEAVEDKTPRTQDEETANNSTQQPSPTGNQETVNNSAGEPTNNSNNVETPSNPNGELANNSSDTSSSNPETTNTPTAENSPTNNTGGFIANVMPIGDNEARQLIQQGKIRNIDIPSVFAVYQGSNTKSLDNSSSYLPSNSPLQPGTLLVSLVIDQNGQFQQAEVLELPTDLQPEKSLYRQLVNDLFKNDTCTPAKNQDGTPLDLSNCYIWVDIKSLAGN
jgi:hypothetical protein